jgi:predicted dehydrogenase
VHIGLVGCGRWGEHILRDLRTLGADVTVVARSAASRQRAGQGGAADIVPSVGDLPNVDGVVVAATTSAHAEVIEAALELSLPIFVEKPMCTDPGTADRLAASAPERLFVMDKWRYHPSVVRIADLAQRKELGEVRGLRTVRVAWGAAHDDSDTVWHLAPHDLSIALEIFGEVPRPNHAVGHVQDGKVRVLHGLLSVNEIWHAVEVSERSPRNERRVELHCDGGVAVLADGWDQHISLHRTDDTTERVETPGELPLLAELRAFTEHLGGGPAPRSSAAEGAAIVRAIADLRALAGAT